MCRFDKIFVAGGDFVPAFPGIDGSKASKAFFFEKKKQKTFLRLSRFFPELRDSEVKSFLVRFFKKGLLASCGSVSRTIGINYVCKRWP